MASFLIDARLGSILDQLFGAGSALTPPGTWYLGLFTAMPTSAGGGTEASYTGYARQPSTNNATEWPNASGSPRTKSNAHDIDFGVAGSGPTNVVGVGFFDAVSAGNLWVALGLTGAPITINNGADVKILATTLVLEGCA
jgi:hypothetical protein